MPPSYRSRRQQRFDAHLEPFRDHMVTHEEFSTHYTVSCHNLFWDKHYSYSREFEFRILAMIY